MSSKAKSGMSAVRQYPESIRELTPPNTFTPGAGSFNGPVRDGKGHSAIHASVTNDTVGTLQILQAWRSTGPFVLVQAIVATADPVSGFFTADFTCPIIRRFVKVVFVAPGPGLGANFELGGYFLPRADSPLIAIAGGTGGASGGGGGSAPANQPTFACNQRAVAVPGTAAQLQAQAVPNGFQIFVRALVGNTGTIYVGPDAATAQNHAVATPLEPGAFLELALTNVNAIFIDADDAGDGVSWTVEVA